MSDSDNTLKKDVTASASNINKDTESKTPKSDGSSSTTTETAPKDKNPPTTTKPTPKPVAKATTTTTKTKTAEPQKPIAQFEKGLSDKIITKFGEKTTINFLKPNRIGIKVDRENVKNVAMYLRDELNFDHAESVCGVDYPADNEIEVVYHLGSYSDDSLSNQVLELATRAPREQTPNPGKDSTVLPSLREVFYSVEFHERECFEMLGVYFDGHPDNRRLLLPEDWADLPPMRKDFAIKGR